MASEFGAEALLDPVHAGRKTQPRIQPLAVHASQFPMPAHGTVDALDAGKSCHAVERHCVFPESLSNLNELYQPQTSFRLPI
jgi:hypothetical protein